MILLIGKDKSSAYSLSIQFGISSGLLALDGFNAANNLKMHKHQHKKEIVREK